MTGVRKSEGYTLLFLEIFIIILNTLTIIVIHRFKQKYNPDILIFTLAVADLLKALIPLNMTLVAYLGGNSMDEGSPKCIIFGWTAFTLNSGIMLVMTVMAIDRYVAICCPFWYKHYLSKKRLIYTIIAVFVFSGLHSMLPLVNVGQMRSYNNGSFCHFDFDSTIPASRGYNIFVLVLGISMLAVVIFCYTRAMFSIKGLIRRQRRMSAPTRDIDNADQKRQAMNRMFARLMIVMMMAFCLSWLLFLIVVLQHVSGWFAINPEAHFWSMRLAVFNSVLNPIIGAAMCRPYRKGYVFILCKCLHCCGLCSSYNAEDPWTRSRKMSACSRNSWDKDQNESKTCTTPRSPSSKELPKSKIRNNPSFNSYYDSGIVPDGNDFSGTLGSHQAGVENDAYEMDTSPAGVTQHISGDVRFKTRPGLSRKRISFKDEIEAKPIAGMLLSEEEAVEPTTSITDTTKPQQHSSSSMSNIATDSPANQDEVNGNENGLINVSNENQPVEIDRMTPLGLDGQRRRKYGLSGYDQFESSSLGRPPGNSDSLLTSNGDLAPKECHITEEKTSHGVKTPLQNLVSRPTFNNEQATEDKLPKGLISTKINSNQNEREKTSSEYSEQRQLTSPRDPYRGTNQEKAIFQTIQVTHFPIGTNSDIKTTTLKSESSFPFPLVSSRSRSFIERTQKISQGQRARSRSANGFSALEMNSSSGLVNTPEKIQQETGHNPHERQHAGYPTILKSAHDTGTLLDTQRSKSGEAPPSEILSNLGRTKSFESILSNTRCKWDSTAYEGLDLPQFQRHSSALKGGELKRTYNWSYSEPDLTCTLPETVFLTSPCTAGEPRGSVICGPQNEGYKENVNSSYQRRASSTLAMPLSPSKIYKQLSELSQKDLEREVFC